MFALYTNAIVQNVQNVQKCTDCQFYTKCFLLQEIGKSMAGLPLLAFGIRSAKYLIYYWKLSFFFPVCTAVEYIVGTHKGL